MATGSSINILGILPDEETNYLRAAHLIVHICPKAVRKLFDSQHPPSLLTGQLAAKQAILQNCKGIDKRHWPMLFPTHGVVKSSDFDITLLMTLLRNFTKIPQPSTRWDMMPAACDHSEGADLVRIRLYRNQIVHSSEATLADSDFKLLWPELENAIDRLSGGTMKMLVNDLQYAVLDQTQREIILTSLKHEKELRLHEEEIKEIKQKREEEVKERRTEIETIKQKHEKEMKVKEEEIREIKMELKQTIPHNIRVQHTYTLEQWKKDDMVFYETNGYKGALELLNSKNYITIIASPGAGKSTIAQHIALKMESEGWEVVPIDGPDELIKYGSFDKKQVFIIDDVVGVFSVDMPRLDVFLRKQKVIMNLIENQTKLIMTCRKVVYNEVQKSKSLLTNFVIDLENSDFKLEDKEKSEILLNHCKVAKISPELYENIPLSNAKVMFPLLCQIFCNEQKYQKIGKQFFQRPNECLLEKLEDLKERIPLQYAGLILLCLNMKNILSKTDFESEENFLSLKKIVFDTYGVNHGTPASEIIKALSLLDGTYTRPASDGFTFIHDSIFELVAYHHGKSYPEHVLKYSSSSYVNNRVTVDDPPSDGSLYIKLEKKHYPLLAERILGDIRALKLYDVFKNPVLKNGMFLDVFIKILQETNFKTFKDNYLKSCHGLQKSNTTDESDKSEQRTKDETDTWMWRRIKDLLETGDIRVIRWIVFYGPTRLLEFVINHVKGRTNIVKRLVPQVTKQSTKLLFGEKEEQTLLLVIGCFSGDVDRVRLILQHVNSSCVNTPVHVWPGYTPLTTACYCHHLPVVDVLIQHRARVDIPDKYGDTPLCIASERGHCDIVRYLIEHSADPNIPDIVGNTPIYIASGRGHCDIIRYLIDHGADLNIHGMLGNTPLYIASDGGHCDIVRYLLDHDADPNIPGYRGNTPLHRASVEGYIDIVRCLIDHGADPNKHEDGKTALDIASEGGHCDIVRYLIDHGADPNIHKYGNTPLHRASGRGHCDIVRYLIDHGADPNIPNQYGYTPLCTASETGHCDIVRYLIDHGADPNKHGEHSNTPLYIASEEGHCDIVKYLIDHSADPNKHKYGNTPLYIASEGGHFDIVRYLIDHSADPNIPNRYGGTPLYTASRRGHCDIVRYLIDHGADPNISDDGHTPLYRASEGGHCDIVSLLLDNAADVSISNLCGTSPLQIAFNSDKMDVVKMIVKHTNKVKTNEGNNQLYHALIQLKHLEVNEEETSRRGRIVYKGSKMTRLPEDLWELIRRGECGAMRNLLMLGLDVNHCDERGRSLVCKVICEWWCKEKEEKVKFLLESGVDINIRDNKCMSVTEHTRRRVCQYREKMKNNEDYKSLCNEYCNVLNVVKCHVRRYSV